MAESLSILLSIATGLALAAAAGFRAFVPLLAAGLAIHFGYLEPARGFDWLGEPVVLVALGVATLAEIAAYYLPGVDHALDLMGAPVDIFAMPREDGARWSSSFSLLAATRRGADSN